VPKTVVFSQWTSFLDIIGACLRTRDIDFCRLDGSMVESKRTQQIHRFREESEVKVFLMSLKAGCLGLNLTVARRVVIVDPWWNPSTEDQATDRVYRLGQTQKVQMVRLIMEKSVELGIMKIQKSKRELQRMLMLDRGELDGEVPQTAEEKRREKEKQVRSLFMM